MIPENFLCMSPAFGINHPTHVPEKNSGIFEHIHGKPYGRKSGGHMTISMFVVGATGNKLTWFKGKAGSNITKRLDRALADVN